MKKALNYLLLIFGLMISNILVTSAAMCSDEEINAFRDKANDIIVAFQFIEDEEKPYFEINILNIEPNFSFVEDINKDVFSPIYDYSFQIKRYKIDSVGKYSFKFYLKDLSCYTNIIRSIDISIPRYNKYSEEPSCQILNQLKACQKSLPTNDQLSEKDIKEVEDAYKKYIQENSSNKKNGLLENKTIYLWIVIGIIGIISITTIIIVIRNNKIKRRGVI